MPIAMHPESDNVYRVEIQGTLRKADLDRCQAELTAEMQRRGPVRLLFVLKGFDGWEPRTDWNDLTFFVKHGDGIERIAIVGPPRWRSESLMFAGADLRRASVEFFPEDDAGQARSWLSS
jgi:SpoIIAA-like